jgi:Na+/H+ antiporter NhaC
MRRTFAAALCLALVALPAAAAFGQADDPAADGHGWLSLVPPLLAIGLALVTRDVLVSLFLGVFSGALILERWNPVAAFATTADDLLVSHFFDADSGHVQIILFTCFLGAMVGLISKSGGTQGIVEKLAKYATDSRRGQIATWVMGVVIFFDDYANTLIVGPTMRPITDRLRISREKLAYIVDSTAAPVVCLFPISTWVGFEIGLIGDAFQDLGLTADPYKTFLSSIPYRFYPIFALFLGFTIAASRFDFGAMDRAEKRAAAGDVLAKDARPIADYGSSEVTAPEHIPKRAVNALLPIATVIAVTVLSLFLSGAGAVERQAGTSTLLWLRDVFASGSSLNALLHASLAGALVALALPIAQRLLRLSEAMGALVGGVKAMLMALVVLTLAWALGSACSELGTADYLVALTQEVLKPAWLPAITFVLSAAVAFATGTSWGTMTILEPQVILVCHGLATAAGLGPSDELYWTYMIGTIAAVLAGSVWGDHCSPISDTTVLSSMATGCDHIAHVRTQVPYALGAGGLALVLGNVLTAYGLSPWVAILLGAVLIVGLVEGYGRWRERRKAPGTV